MKHYIEITLLPNVEVPLYFLWEKVYQQIHIALVEMQRGEGKGSIGVSFPEYDSEKYQLGGKLRLFARGVGELECLAIDKWLSRLADYVHITGVRDVVPERIRGYEVFRRIQTKSSTVRLARRKSKREGISFDNAMRNLCNHKEQMSKAPYINVKSLSSEKRYRLLIGRTDAELDGNVDGFSTYGLSSQTSVPIF